MKTLLSIKNILAVILIALVWFGLFHAIKEISRQTEKGIVPGYLVSVRSDGVHELPKTGYMKEQFIGTYQFDDFKIESPVSDAERYQLMATGKPVAVLWKVTAAKIGRDKPFWGDFSHVLFILTVFLTFLAWVIWDIRKTEKKYGKTAF